MEVSLKGPTFEEISLADLSNDRNMYSWFVIVSFPKKWDPAKNSFSHRTTIVAYPLPLLTSWMLKMGTIPSLQPKRHLYSSRFVSYSKAESFKKYSLAITPESI